MTMDLGILSGDVATSKVFWGPTTAEIVYHGVCKTCHGSEGHQYMERHSIEEIAINVITQAEPHCMLPIPSAHPISNLTRSPRLR